jgi:hypothetical protein
VLDQCGASDDTNKPYLARISVELLVKKLPAQADPPPLKWSDLRYVFDIKEDCNGKEAIQA